MTLVKSGFFAAAILIASFLTPCFAQTTGGDIFTISVTGTAAKDVQLRYLLTDTNGGHRFLSSAQVDGDNILVKTTSEGKQAKSFKAILLAPGCQLVTISVDDLTASNQGAFQCQKLSTISFQGQVDVSSLGQQSLQVNVLYQCSWAGKFFGMGSGSFSPVLIVTAPVASDGTFSVDIPNFANDQTWISLSNDATLEFSLGLTNGKRVALIPPYGLGTGSEVKVAVNYPPLVQFTLKP